MIAEYREDERQIQRLRDAEAEGDPAAGVNIEAIEERLLRLRSTEVFRDLISRAEARARRDIQNTMNERARQKNEKKLRTEEMHRIVKIKDRLDRAALNPTKGKYIPAGIIKSYAQLVKGMDAVTYDIQQRIEEVDRKIDKIDLRISKTTDSRISEQLKTSKEELISRREKYISRRDINSRHLSDLSAEYERILNDENYGYIYDGEVAALIKDAAAINKPLYEMTLEELETVSRAMTAMVKTINDARETIITGVDGFDGQNVETLNRSAIREVRSRHDNPAISRGNNKISSIVWAQLAPREVFEILGNHTKDGVFGKVFHMLENAQTKQLAIKVEATQMFEEFYNSKEFEKLSSTKESDMIDLGFVDENGESIKVTRGFMLSVYMNLLNRDNAEHMIIGGLTVPDFKQYYKGKVGEAFSNSSRTVGFSADLAALYGKIRETQKEIDRLQALNDDTNPETREKISDLEDKIKGYAFEARNVRDESMVQIAKMKQTIESQLTEWTCICQAALETGWGQSALMIKAHAYFGVKATSNWHGMVFSSETGEVYDGKHVIVNANFRAYDNPEDSVNDYFDLLEWERYSASLKAKTVQDCITIIRAGGYATDPAYISSIINIYNGYKTWIEAYTVAAQPAKPKYDNPGVITYQAYSGHWWDEVKSSTKLGTESYAGAFGTIMSALRIKAQNGKITMQSHLLNGSWLPKVSEYNNTADGYAGLYGVPMDGVKIWCEYGACKYRVHLLGGGWLPWVSSADSNGTGADSYAGVYGKKIDAIQIA